MIKGIIFDFAGPIAKYDNRGVFAKYEIEKGLQKDVIRRTADAYFKGAHQGDYDSWYDFYKQSKEQWPVAASEMENIFHELELTMSVDPQMVAYILSLKPKYKIALLSNFTSNLNRMLKEDFKIYDLFDAVVNSSEIKVVKPHPKAYLYTLDKLQLEPHESVFIDDLAQNVDAAVDLGITGIVYENFDQTKNDLENILTI